TREWSSLTLAGSNPSIHPSIHSNRPFFPSIHPLTHLSIYVPFHPFILLSNHPLLLLSLFYPFFFPSIHPSIPPSLHHLSSFQFLLYPSIILSLSFVFPSIHKSTYIPFLPFFPPSIIFCSYF
ncbi:hypothetical protein E2I00_017869, partial [Balaenoptera physalus]